MSCIWRGGGGRRRWRVDVCVLVSVVVGVAGLVAGLVASIGVGGGVHISVKPCEPGPVRG